MSKQIFAIIGAVIGIAAMAGVAYLAITKYMERKRLEEYYYDDDDECYYDCDCDECADEDEEEAE